MKPFAIQAFNEMQSLQTQLFDDLKIHLNAPPQTMGLARWIESVDLNVDIDNNRYYHFSFLGHDFVWQLIYDIKNRVIQVKTYFEEINHHDFPKTILSEWKEFTYTFNQNWEFSYKSQVGLASIAFLGLYFKDLTEYISDKYDTKEEKHTT